MSSEFILSQTVDRWFWFLEMQSNNIYQYICIFYYYLFTDKDSLQESHVYLALLADVEVRSVSVYPEAQLHF